VELRLLVRAGRPLPAELEDLPGRLRLPHIRRPRTGCRSRQPPSEPGEWEMRERRSMQEYNFVHKLLHRETRITQ